MTDRTTMQITPYFIDSEKYPNIIGVRAEGDECETAYVRKSDMAEAVDYWRRMYEGVVGTRWHDLFGTSERAARTMAGKCGDCCECVIANACEYGDGEGCLLSDEGDYDALLEWLKGADE